LYIFSFVMLRPLPLSTLFPYTTLFRSLGHRLSDDVDALGLEALEVGQQPALGEDGGRAHRLGSRAARLVAVNCNDRGRLHRLVADRKSTRLNSSHVKISYAVFCLKKKK